MLTSLDQISPVTNDPINQDNLQPCQETLKIALHNTLSRIMQCIIRERLLPFNFSGTSLAINCIKSNVALICDNTTRFAMSRIKIKGQIFISNNHLRTPLITLNDLFRILEKEWDTADNNQLNKFFEEVHNSHKNMIAVLTHVANTHKTLKSLFGNTDLITLTKNLPTNTQAIFYEQWASQGHPFHPCIKVKYGLSDQELTAYCPEFSPIVTISLLAIHKSIATTELEKDNDDFSSKFNINFPELFSQFNHHLSLLSLNPDNFLPLFIHPWQEKNILPTLFKTFIAQNKIIKIPKAQLAMRPSLSFRTVCSSDNIPQIKLPTTVLCTGAIRTLSPNTIHNSPQVSRILRHILNNNHPELASLRILYDSTAIRIATGIPETDKQLGMMLRDNVESAVNPSEMPIITAALFSDTLKENTPLLIEIINMHYQNSTTTNSNIMSYFSELVNIILKPNLFLYAKYGIALEGHQQNSFIIFKEYKPQAILMKDLGGVRIHAPTLNLSQQTIKPYPKSVTITDDICETRNKLFHAVYQSLLAEIIVLLTQHYEVSESLLWDIVKLQTIKYLHEINEQIEDTDFLNRETKALTQDDWPIKSFIAMRLNNTYANYIYSSTKNPMNTST
jgi:siderophore synthetase component